MRHKLLLAGMWTAIIAVIALSVVLFGPRLLARYYVSRLVPPGTPEADNAYRRLCQLGTSAVPELLAAIDEREPELLEWERLAPEALFNVTTPDPDRNHGSLLSTAWHERRKASATETRAELCIAILLDQWESLSIDEASHRKILRRIFSGWLWSDGSENRLDGPPIPLHFVVAAVILGHRSFISIDFRHELVVRRESGDVSIKSHGAGTGGPKHFKTKSSGLPSNPSTNFRWHAGMFNGSGGIDPKELGPGKHQIYFHVTIGLVTKFDSTTNQAEPPPYNEEKWFGPIEIEVKSPQTPAQRALLP